MMRLRSGGATIHMIHDPFGRLIAGRGPGSGSGASGSTGAVLREYIYLGLMPAAMIDHSNNRPRIGGNIIPHKYHPVFK